MDKRRKIVVDHTKYVRHLVPLFEKEGLGVCAAETIVFSRPDVIAATAEQDFTSRLTAWCSANHNQLKSGVAHAYDTSASRGYLELERPHAAQVERQTHQAPLTRDFVDPS